LTLHTFRFNGTSFNSTKGKCW